jgi:hypothetical protein
MNVIDYVNVVGTVVHDKAPLRESIKEPNPELDELAKTRAARECCRYLGECEEADKARALMLLLTLAVLENPHECFQREGLALLAARNSGASECERGERRRLAALERRKPLNDVDWYVKRHLDRTIARIAGDLRALVEHREALAAALERNGRIACMRYLATSLSMHANT